MRILTSALLGAGLMLGTASVAHAQLGSLKDLATKAATDAATDRAKDVIQNSEPGSITSSDLSTSESLTVGKTLLGGGSVTDAAVAVGRSRVETRVNDQVEKVKSDPASFGSGLLGNNAPAEQAPVQNAPTVTAPTPAISCPAGTTAQPNGTCMITGSWGS